MRRGSFPIVIVLAAAAIALSSACVGEAPTTSSGGPAVGDRLGSCFADGKCKEGLVCFEGEICLNPGEDPPADAGVDAPVTPPLDATPGPDASKDAPTGGDGGACKIAEPKEGAVTCQGAPCGSGEVCCATPQSAQCRSFTQCEAIGGKKFACDSAASCGDPLVRCCIATSEGTAGATCPERIVANGSSCIQGNACPLAAPAVACSSNADCGNGVCKPMEVELAPGVIAIWGICS